MQRCVAFIFTKMPYGSSSAQEGLDSSLATCILSDQVGIFFISDGVFSILSDQRPRKNIRKNFMLSFEMLLLCGVRDIYLCADSACERGLTKEMNWISEEVVWLSSKNLRHRLSFYDIALRF